MFLNVKIEDTSKYDGRVNICEVDIIHCNYSDIAEVLTKRTHVVLVQVI